MDAGWDTFAADVVRWNLQKSRGRLRREAEARAAAQAAARQAANVDAHPRKKRKKEQHRREPVNPEAPVGSHERWVDDPMQSNWWKLMQRRGVRVLGTRAYHKFRAHAAAAPSRKRVADALPRAALEGWNDCVDATDIIVRRVELHHPRADEGRRHTLPQFAMVRTRS